MNDEALDRLFAKAREAGPRDTAQAEFAFETRLASRLATGPRQRSFSFAVWICHPLPVFAVIAFALAWSAWQSANDREMDIRTAMDSGSAEWDYVEGITGSAL